MVASETLRNVLAAFESEGPACEVVEKSRALQVERMPPHLSRIFDIIANEWPLSRVTERSSECDT